MSSPSRPFYGWTLVAYLLFVQVLTIGFLFYGFGVLLDPMSGTLGLTRGETTYGFSLFTLGVAVWSPVVSRLVEALGPRRPMLVGIAALAAALVALGRLHSAAAYYAVMAVWVSFGVAAGAGVPAQTLIVNWFRRSRGMALSLTSAGVSMGGLVMAPAVGWLVPLVGWSKAILLPTALLVLAVPLGMRIVRNRPEDMGLTRDGLPEVQADPLDELPPPSLREILADKRFRTIAITYALAMGSMTSLMVILVAYWTDLGVPARWATLAFALLAGVGMVGKPFFGRLADRVDAKAGAMASFAFLMAGTLVLLWPSQWNMLLFIPLFGLGIGGAVPMQSAINGALFGREQFARISGILTPWVVGVQSLFYGLTGYAHDRLQSYAPLFVAFALLYAVCLALLRRLDLVCESEPVTT